jgi:16S rRNA (guanine527-N7)-methyltransferase
MTPAATLAAGLDRLALALPEEATRRLLDYVGLLCKWNRTYNLTAIREPERMVSHHLIDSLAILPHMPPGTLVDIGAGAGLPGIPVAIAQPERSVTLNDSNQKKGAFMQQAAIELGLSNVAVHVGRAEDWRPAERFDGAVSRAFASLADYIAACRHLVKPGGFLAAMKGLHPDEELAGLPRGIECTAVVKLEVPFVNGERHLVLCRAGT